MPVFSLGRDAIFHKESKAALQIDGFPNLYALLGVERDASRAQIDDAITARGADLLAVSFSRGGKNEWIGLLERHLHDFRPVLLDKTTKLSYDEQLARHESGDPQALSFPTWKQTAVSTNRLSRGLKVASHGLKARFKAALWDAEYM
jgi:hypothetical protein